MKQSTLNEYARLADKAFDAWLKAGEYPEHSSTHITQAQLAKEYAQDRKSVV